MMAIVDINYEKYPCPHCKGFTQVRQQFYYEGGYSHTLQHIDEKGDEVELELAKEAPSFPTFKKAPPKRLGETSTIT